MVRIHPDPPERNLARVASQSRREASTCTKAYTRRRATKSGEAKGAVAQLGERLLCKQEIIGSIPFSSTNRGSEVRDQGSEKSKASDEAFASGFLAGPSG